MPYKKMFLMNLLMLKESKLLPSIKNGLLLFIKNGLFHRADIFQEERRRKPSLTNGDDITPFE